MRKFVAITFLFLSSLAQGEQRPNVLFIALDDLNDWVGCLGGHPQTKTPNLDRFAASGVLFRNAYCPAPSCKLQQVAFAGAVAANDHVDSGDERELRALEKSEPFDI